MVNGIHPDSIKKISNLSVSGFAYEKNITFTSKINFDFKLVTRTGYEYFFKKSTPAKINGKFYSGLFFSIRYTFPTAWLNKLKDDTSELTDIMYDILDDVNKVYKDPSDHSVSIYNYEKRSYVPCEQIRCVLDMGKAYIPHLDMVACNCEDIVDVNDFPIVNISVSDTEKVHDHKENVLDYKVYTNNISTNNYLRVLGNEFIIPDNLTDTISLVIKKQHNSDIYTQVHSPDNIPECFKENTNTVTHRLNINKKKLTEMYLSKRNVLLEQIKIQEEKNRVEVEKSNKLFNLEEEISDIDKKLLYITNLNKISKYQYDLYKNKLNNKVDYVDLAVSIASTAAKLLLV